MALTNKNLLLERPHPLGGGVQRLYRFKSGYGLSLVNSPELHFYRFAWEAAVLMNVTKDGEHFDMAYDTELIGDVAVFGTDQEANAFIKKAEAVLGGK